VGEPPPQPNLALPPHPDAERLTSLDLVRGVAVLGILPVNIGWFFMTQPGWWNPWLPDGDPGNGPVALLTWFFFEQKFITLFSLLFGAGLAIRFDRARARGGPFAERLLRRQGVLLLFGILHLHLLFYGDILTTYALLGSIAWLACWLGQRELLIVAAGFFGAACVIWSWMWLSPPGELERGVQPLAMNWVVLLDEWPMIFGTNRLGLVESMTSGAGMGSRLFLAAYFGLTVWITYGLYVLACFLLGMYLMRSGVFHDPGAHRQFLRGLALTGLALGIPLNAAFAATQALLPEATFLTLFSGIAAPPMSLAYLSLLLLWSASGRLPRLRRWLRATGRMALTNYLSQSLFLNLLFTGIGLGRFTQHFGRLAALGVIVLIWSFQIAFSAAWLRLFRMGPVEWLWRTLAGDRPRGLARPPGAPSEAI
jgi:uncharacterized protein